jgi:hypothetical protein
MKYNGRGILAVNTGGSVKDRWLDTTMSGPKGGTLSRPVTFRRPKVWKQNRASDEPKR